MASIEAVTLDLWQTLVVDTREWGRLRTQIRIDDTVAALQEVGEQVTEEQVKEKGKPVIYKPDGKIANIN